MLFGMNDVDFKYRCNLDGSDSSLDIVFGFGEGGVLCCLVNDVTILLDHECSAVNNKEFKQVLGFFNDFIDRNYRRKKDETVISAEYLVSFLHFLYEVTDPTTINDYKQYSYYQFYHMSLINNVHTKESTKRKRSENTLELPKQKRTRKAKEISFVH